MSPLEHLPIVMAFFLLYMFSSTICLLTVGFCAGAHYGRTLDLDLKSLYEKHMLPLSRDVVTRARDLTE